MKILAMIFITLVVIEFGIHIIYHAITGKARFKDPAFSYLDEICHLIKNKILYLKARKILKKTYFHNAYSINYAGIYNFRNEKTY